MNAENPVLPARMLSSREVGMILIAFGFFGLLFGLIQYSKDKKKIREATNRKYEFSFTPVLAMLMLIFSLLLFLAALFKQ